MEKIPRSTLAEQVYLQIEQKIHTGDWPLGARIPNEKELMAQLGVSRNTLREAIRALASVGLLEARQGDGTFVTAKSELDAILQKRAEKSAPLEILEVRRALEKEAVALACRRKTAADMAEILRLQAACQMAASSGSEEQFVEQDTKLHLAIVAASHNQLLFDIYANLIEQIRHSIVRTAELTKETIIGHPALIEAIDCGDVEKAQEEVSRYIRHFQQLILHEEVPND
ncbi:FadR/GntR family transcriptional regulator [Listeria costaricensis]|uniref:FadR/GntR family transcriptional regulator n=1 Tax=Listeria costaricensis TaxID=2026604 RepID=UPI000C074178|nr:FadR/GntR family transcriptional regulator [Listeria costaricensis]